MTGAANGEDLAAILQVLTLKPEDDAAWRRLFLLLWPFVTAIVWRRLRDRTAAEDAAQEVFIRLVKAKPFAKIDGAPQLRAYVWRTAVNVANDHAENKRRQQLRENEARELGTPEITLEPAQSEDHLLFGEALALAHTSLLPEENRLLLLLLKGQNLRETAQELGQSYSATAVRLHRVRDKLHKLLFSQ